jgi:N-acetyl-alpha-D-muramate 1-phosphate uridylyltransferase
MKALLLSAGKGTRLNGYQNDKPKPLIEVLGKTLLDRQIQNLLDASFSQIIINVSHKSNLIKEHLSKHYYNHKKIIINDEGPEPLETGGAVIDALPLIGEEDFVLTNVDLITSFPYSIAIEGDLKNTLILVPNPPHNMSGDYSIMKNGNITKRHPGLTYSGISVLSPKLFYEFDPGVLKLTEVFDQAIQRELLKGYVYSGAWFDVGTVERINMAEDYLKSVRLASPRKS